MSPGASCVVPLGLMSSPRLPLPPDGRRVSVSAVLWCPEAPLGAVRLFPACAPSTPGTVLWKMRGVEEKRALVPKQLGSGAELWDVARCSPVPSRSHLSMELLQKPWAKLCLLLASWAEHASWEGDDDVFRALLCARNCAKTLANVTPITPPVTAVGTLTAHCTGTWATKDEWKGPMLAGGQSLTWAFQLML